jgi:hypothetical protein
MLHLIINISEIPKIDFTEILENSPAELKTSSDGNRTWISYETEPSFLSDLDWKSQVYQSDEMNSILMTHEWRVPSI